MKASMNVTDNDVRFLMENLMENDLSMKLSVEVVSPGCYTVTIEGGIKYVLSMLSDYKQYNNL